VKLVQAIWKIATAAFTITFCSLLFSQLASTEVLKWVNNKGMVHFKHYKSIPGKYCQNPEGKYWEELTGENVPLTLVDWQLVTQPGSADKYIDNRIVGTVKNNSGKAFSEVKIEFSVYDEKGAQIAIVSSNLYSLSRVVFGNLKYLLQTTLRRQV
jgi:hypothetical protein